MKFLRTRRRHPRIKSEIEVTVSLIPDNQRVFQAFVLNVGEGGMRLAMPERLFIGNKVVVHMKMPAYNYGLNHTGSVVWCHTPIRLYGCFDAGIKFDVFEKKDKKILHKFIFMNYLMQHDDIDIQYSCSRKISQSIPVRFRGKIIERWSWMPFFTITIGLVMLLYLLYKYFDITGRVRLPF